jgi:aspartate racemase
MKVIGIVGGLAPESSALYYRVMNRLATERRGGQHSARVVLDSLDYHDFAEAQERGDWDGVVSMLVASARRLEGAGAELIVIACNTAHRDFEAIERAIACPLLHVADASGAALRTADRKRIALLGTRYVMDGGFIAERLAARHALDVQLPTAAERERVHAIILDELVTGTVRPESRAFLADLARSFATRGADALLLACTELGLLFPELDAGDGATDATAELALPIYDTARLHARAAVELALA